MIYGQCKVAGSGGMTLTAVEMYERGWEREDTPYPVFYRINTIFFKDIDILHDFLSIGTSRAANLPFPCFSRRPRHLLLPVQETRRRERRALGKNKNIRPAHRHAITKAIFNENYGRTPRTLHTSVTRLLYSERYGRRGRLKERIFNASASPCPPPSPPGTLLYVKSAAWKTSFA